MPESLPLRTPQELEKPLQHDRVIPSERITIQKAVLIALANNPDLATAFYSVCKAKYQYQASFAGYFPEINADFSLSQSTQNTYDRKNPPSDVLERESIFSVAPGVSASLLIFDGFEREYRVLIASQNILAQEAVRKNAERILTNAVIQTCYDIQIAVENKKIAYADLEFQESCLHQAESRFRNGFVPLDNILNFKISREQALSRLSQYDNAERVANCALCALLGLTPMEFSGIQTDVNFSRRAPLAPLDEYLHTAAEQRPDLDELRHEANISGYRKYAIYSRFYPVITAHTGLNFSTNAGRTGGIAYSTYYHNTVVFSYGIYAKWNLFRGFYDYFGIREQEQEFSVQISRLRQKWLSVAEEVASAYSDYQNSLLQEKYYRNISQWAEKQRDLVKSSYFSGNETITRLNGAQSALIAARARYVGAVIQREKAFAGLCAAAGLPQSFADGIADQDGNSNGD